MSKTRANPKALNKSAAQVAANAAADKARKAASRAALKAQRAADAAIPPLGAATPPAPASDVPAKDHAAENLAALRIEADVAFGGDIAAAAESMGVDPATGLPPAEKKRYDGPMLALVSARVHYTKAANGILCNGDPFATLCGQYSRLVVVTGLIAALELPGNPYLALNAGQQSMNLRNKARHALKAGTLTMAQVEAALTRAFEASTAKAA